MHIPFVINRSIVFATWFVQLDTTPVATGKVRFANVLEDARAAAHSRRHNDTIANRQISLY